MLRRAISGTFEFRGLQAADRRLFELVDLSALVGSAVCGEQRPEVTLAGLKGPAHTSLWESHPFHSHLDLVLPHWSLSGLLGSVRGVPVPCLVHAVPG